jgi:hypothetical protein
MSIKFTYNVDGDSGKVNIEILKGELKPFQKEVLLNEIGKNLLILIANKKGEFIPSSPIEGFPDSMVFNYFYDTPISATSRSAKLVFENGINTYFQVPPVFHNSIDLSSKNVVSAPEIKQSEWVDLYLKELIESINQVLSCQLEHHEKIGLEYSRDEFSRSLKEDYRENSLFLFSIYLQYAVQQFSQEDKEKAGLFSLAIRALEKYKQHNKTLE